VILYHFTSKELLAEIMASGFLRVTDSDISLERRHAGPDVVWLTNNPDPSAQGWGFARTAEITLEEIESGIFGAVELSAAVAEKLRKSGRAMFELVDKTCVRFTVEIPEEDAFWWPRWSRGQGITERVYQALALAAAPALPEQWYVVTRPVLRSEWVKVQSKRVGQAAGG
jgi:hypothetical protein